MDPEKQAGPDSLYSSSAYDARMVEQQPQHRGKLVATKFLRGVQYVTLIVSLPFVCCAIDRKFWHQVSQQTRKLFVHRLVAGTLDAVAAVLLLATFVYFVCNSSSGKGVCGGPAQIGHWENHQGCERLGVATGFAGVAFGTFVASAILAFVS
ncbi:hypothetical protein LTR15_001900 [Elasticomyces elasticus]|nr:hypothetical protein LTR15_001900 [Elasticomyces elasticus]